MSVPPKDPLLHSLQVVSGRRPGDEAPDPAWRAAAERLVESRRRVLKGPACPQRVLRRAQRLFASRAPRPVAALLRLVFDSWAHAAPATRGRAAPRTLRYEGDRIAVDLRIVRPRGERPLLQIAVDPIEPGLQAVVRVGGRPLVAPLDLGAGGATEVRVRPTARKAVVAIRARGQELFRTPPVPLE